MGPQLCPSVGRTSEFGLLFPNFELRTSYFGFLSTLDLRPSDLARPPWFRSFFVFCQ